MSAIFHCYPSLTELEWWFRSVSGLSPDGGIGGSVGQRWTPHQRSFASASNRPDASAGCFLPIGSFAAKAVVRA